MRSGVRQNLGFTETIALWGDKAQRLPAWFTQRFAAQYQATQLFDSQLPMGFGLQSLPAGRPEVLVSVPERALLELLSDIGKDQSKGQSVSGARELTEGLPNLREAVLDELLSHTTRIKVVRIAAVLAQELQLPWANLAKSHSLRIGGGQRWIAVSKSGERLDLKRP